MPLSFELNAGTDTHVSLVKQLQEDVRVWYQREQLNDSIAQVTPTTSVLLNLADLDLLMVVNRNPKTGAVYERFIRLIEPNPTVKTIPRLESLFVFLTLKYGTKFMNQYTDDFYGAIEKVLDSTGKLKPIDRSQYPAWIVLHPLIQQVYFLLN